jgi:sec-independent protein translocase protein TatB
MASEFQSQFNDAMREAELDEIRKQVEGVNQSVADFNPIQTVRDELKGAIEGPASAGAQAAPDPSSPALVEPPLALPASSDPLPLPIPPEPSSSPAPVHTDAGPAGEGVRVPATAAPAKPDGTGA